MRAENRRSSGSGIHHNPIGPRLGITRFAHKLDGRIRRHSDTDKEPTDILQALGDLSLKRRIVKAELRRLRIGFHP